MNDTTQDQGQSARGSRRAALSVLIVLYTLGLAGISSLLVMEANRKHWRDCWTNWTRSLTPKQRQAEAKQLAAASPASDPTAVRPGRRVSASRLPVRSARSARSRRPSSRRTNRVTRAPRSPAATYRSDRRKESAGAARVARQGAGAQRKLRMIVVPQRAPLVTWAHPPDMSLPPECRPRNPVVARQF